MITEMGDKVEQAGASSSEICKIDLDTTKFDKIKIYDE